MRLVGFGVRTCWVGKLACYFVGGGFAGLLTLRLSLKHESFPRRSAMAVWKRGAPDLVSISAVWPNLRPRRLIFSVRCH